MLPLTRSGRIRAPWPPTACARLPYPSVRLHRWRHLSWSSGSTELSSAFAASRPVGFASRLPFVGRGLTTLLSIAMSRCRPAASSVCTLPLVLQVDKDPLGATPGSLRWARSEERAFPLKAGDFPRARISVSVVRLSTSRSSGPRGPGDNSGFITSRLLRYACYPC